MSAALLRLSSRLHDAIPHLLAIGVVRKVAASLVRLVFLPVWPRTGAFAEAYSTADRAIGLVWATAYAAVLAYAAFDIATNLADFLSCGKNQAARPTAIFCAVALCSFLFTTKLSASSLSIVVLLCAEQQNVLTGLAAALCVASWVDSSGSSVLLAVCALLSGLHFGFCAPSSSALLCLVCCGWLAAWAGERVTGVAVNALVCSFKKPV